MTMKVAKEGWVIICDDIRREENKLFSLIGVYERDFAFNRLPTLIPELCFSIFLREVKVKKFKWEITFKLPEAEPIILAGTSSCPPNTTNLHIIGGISPIRITAEGKKTSSEKKSKGQIPRPKK
jgi:hypothetical protein